LEARIQNDASIGLNHGEDNIYSLGLKLQKNVTTWIFTLVQNAIKVVQKIKIKMAIT
jgi:hypothetical protein